jgi:hypothetical protein
MLLAPSVHRWHFLVQVSTKGEPIMMRKRPGKSKDSSNQAYLIAALTVTVEQAVELEKAFEDGKLRDFGVIGMRMRPATKGEPLGIGYASLVSRPKTTTKRSDVERQR